MQGREQAPCQRGPCNRARQRLRDQRASGRLQDGLTGMSDGFEKGRPECADDSRMRPALPRCTESNRNRTWSGISAGRPITAWTLTAPARPHTMATFSMPSARRPLGSQLEGRRQAPSRGGQVHHITACPACTSSGLLGRIDRLRESGRLLPCKEEHSGCACGQARVCWTFRGTTADLRRILH